MNDLDKYQVLDKREVELIDKLGVRYEKYHTPGLIEKSTKQLTDKVTEVMPDTVKEFYSNATDKFSETEIYINLMKITAQGFKDIELKAAALSVDEKSVIKRLQKINPEITEFEEICLIRSYEIEKVIMSKEYQDMIATIIQAGATGFAGFVGILPNIVLSMFLYFRAVQSIAMHYGYDVKGDASEMEFASQVLMGALSPNADKGVESVTGLIGKMMMTSKATALKQALGKKTYEEMAKKGGTELIFVQIRAMTNKAAQKALDKAGKEQLEKTVFNEILEQMSKRMTQKAGKKMVPVIGGVISAFIDAKYMGDILKYSKIVYHKRFLLEKSKRAEKLNSEEVI